MQLFQTMFVLRTLGALRAQPAAAQIALGAQAAEADPDRRQQWLVPSPIRPQRRSRDFVSLAGRRAVSPRDRRACDLAERVASRSNAAAGISRFGGLAGGARLRGAGA